MILKYPYPNKAWFTIANDPDNTTIEDWHELNQFLWNLLALPISNSLFVKSLNYNLPNQVNLVDNPEILSQKHDMIHTWGDYMHSRKRGFDRQDAIEACQILEKKSIKPKVWIDHSQFIGNILHNDNKGSIPETSDASGIRYTNYAYTLDLVKKIGIRYIWDGEITDLIGQDRKVSNLTYFNKYSNSRTKTFIRLILSKIINSTKLRNLLRLNSPDNRQYSAFKFPDGNKLYRFKRYGTWKDADIYGLGEILAKSKIDLLIKNEGTMVAYTHLGKRPASKSNEPFHIPDKTKNSLKYIKEKYDEQVLMISPLSNMLDYLVLRDNIKLHPKINAIEFLPDGIRYTNIRQSDLTGKKFSFINSEKKFDPRKIKFFSDDLCLKFNIQIEKRDNVFSVIFK
tara:strand:- start:1327 stop:2517 length:1191 start_codon:yes stop_codon:yes gene_type:complete